MKKATTIFYVNSFGILCQWKGEIINHDEKSISIRFSKNKALKFELKNLDIQFVLVTKKTIKSQIIGNTQTCFDENLQEQVLKFNENNISMLWKNRKWEVA